MTQNTAFIGQHIGNYQITQELAKGGFGSVYLAHHRYLPDRTVVIKLLHTHYLTSAEERQHFLQEAQMLEKLRHPHILPILDVGVDDSILYLVTEYAQGGSLRDRLRQAHSHPLPMGESLHILSQIGQALQHAHDQQIIHRDLKPENILFDVQGNALLADFGIATTLTTASIKLMDVRGTPAYMAPEQYRGIVSKESDQYAVACMAYELVTGEKPFAGPDIIAMGFQHAIEQPLSPRSLNSSLPEQVDKALLRALSKDRSARYPNITSFIAALRASSETGQQAKDRPTISGRSHFYKETTLLSPGNGPLAPTVYPTPSKKSASPLQRLPDRPPKARQDLGDPFEAISDRAKTLAGFCYIPYAWPFYAWISPNNRFARFHFMQAFLLWVIIGATVGIAVLTDPAHSFFDLFLTAWPILFFIYGIVGVAFMCSGFGGAYSRLPLIWRIADWYSGKRTL
ncbi:MAG TPA: serine/threonine-protein kinase [Ktedonosporobacter sp.]|nr:serine/threonine-protein kinase [Ktedonosporobacter sp.]